MEHSDKKNSYLSPLLISSIYFVVAILWILLSDFALQNRTINIQFLSLLQTYKGFLFVFATSWGLYFLIRRYSDQIESKEKALENQKNRLLRSQRIGEIGDWEFEVESECISWSPMMYEIFERDPKKGPPDFSDIQSAYYGKTIEKHNEVVERAVRDGEDFDVDLQLGTEKGKHKYVKVIGHTIKDESGKVRKLVGTVQDVTKRKEVERALLKSKQRMENITNNTPGVVFQYKLKPDGTDLLQFVSEGSREIWGVAAEEAVAENEKIWEGINSADLKKVRQSIETSAKTMKRWDEEWRYTKPDGDIRWQHGTGIPNKLEDGSIIWDSVILDITEKKQMRERVIRSAIEAQDEERRRIAQDLHDGIGQYLSASNMNLESIRNHIEELPEKYINRYKAGLSLLKKSIKEIRNVAHNLMPEVLKDYGLVLAIKALLENLRKSTKITFHFETNLSDSDLDREVALNLYRIVQEALNNAVKHGECSNISLQVYQNEHSVECLIEDDGVGFQIDEQAIDQGFGLKNMKTRIHSLSGTFDFNSRPGEGMSILIDIPIS